MEFLTDTVFLARLQFAVTCMYHFLYVPLTVGMGLVVAIVATRAHKSGKEEDAHALEFWVKIFTATFAVGVATGITMEFQFGTNWADYARYVGDIFGAPLAAEALLAFFMESVFLGILIFGKNKISSLFRTVSAWLVWIGSCLSALWIIVANSWMQTAAGAELSSDGSHAVLTDFVAAVFNDSMLTRYSHVVVGLLITGACVAIAVAAWYLLKNKHSEFAMKTMRMGTVLALVLGCVMLVTAHSSAVTVSEEQPTKFAAMEGMYEDDIPPLYLFGWVDETNQKVITPFSLAGGTSFLATGTWDTEYEGLNTLSESEEYSALDVENMPVNAIFQSYHLMVIMYGCFMLLELLAIFFTYRGGKIKNMRWLQKLLVILPLFPTIAIQAGWLTAELGRQPWVVYPSAEAEGVSLLTAEATSGAVSGVELFITIILFVVIYALIIIAWARIVSGIIKKGPETAVAVAGGAGTTAATAEANAEGTTAGTEQTEKEGA